MSEISNLTKEEAVRFLTQIIADGQLQKGIEGMEEDLESAIRVALAHLGNGDTNKVATAVEAIFQMYRRNDVTDKSYRNAARFILSVVDEVPVRYESYEETAENDRLQGFNLAQFNQNKEEQSE